MKIKWSPRVTKGRLARLYKLNAMRIVDHELLHEVATILYMRCKDIIAVHDAHYNWRVRCPSCYAAGNEQYLSLPKEIKRSKRDAYMFHCSTCGDSFSWKEFRSSHSRRQMNIGGAGDAFRHYITQYERNLDDNALMLAVDRLIHEFHYALKADGATQQASRIAAANLIDSASMTETIEFLDDLSNNLGDDANLKATAKCWRENVSRYERKHLPESMIDHAKDHSGAVD